MSTLTHCTSQSFPDGASFTRRDLLKSAALGGVSLAGMTAAPSSTRSPTSHRLSIETPNPRASESLICVSPTSKALPCGCR